MDPIHTLVPVGSDLDVHRGARRASRRVSLDAEVVMLEPRRGYGFAINVSAGGIRIALDELVEIGEECELLLRTAPDREWIERARVVWSRELPDGYVYGLEFV